MYGQVRYGVLQCGAAGAQASQAPRAPDQGRSGLKEAGGVSSQSACLDLQHPTFQAPWRHHYRSMCVQTIAIVIAIPLSSQRSCPGAAAGHADHTTQGSRQFLMNTPHSLSEDVPAALSSISNQARPGTKAQ